MPAAPSAATKSMGRVTDVNPRQPSSCLSRAIWSLSTIGRSSAIWWHEFGPGLQQVALAPGTGEDRGHQLLADRVQRRVRHLGEELLEVVEQRLGTFGEHGQGRVVAHRADRFLAVCPHRAEDVLEVFQRVAERLLALEQRPGIGPGNVRGRRQVGQRHHELAEPLAVGLGRGDLMLELIVVDDPALFQIDQEHLARFEPSLLRGRSPVRSRARRPPRP